MCVDVRKCVVRAALLAVMILGGALSGQSSACAAKRVKTDADEKVIVAYVTSWSRVMPDAQYMTHINYAFGHVTKSFDGVRIDNERRLRSITALKKDNPHLKVMLSVGGWGSGNFSEMAADKHLRRSFAKDCKRVMKEFNLDGIDIDWEYPTSRAAGISASPDDTENFTLLMHDLRKALGRKALLTLASVGSAKFVDFPAILKYIDFVNIMAYDMGGAPKHHSALFSSKNTNMSAEDAVMAHLKAGVPMSKLVLGMAFYGRGGGKGGFPNSMNYNRIPRQSEKYEERWDFLAQAPYLVDMDGRFVFGFENARSLAAKCRYVQRMGMKGAMYWEYSGDNDENVLRRAVYEGILGKPIADEQLQGLTLEHISEPEPAPAPAE